MSFPVIKIDLQKIKYNTSVIASACSKIGADVVGVIKACLGNVDVARAMVEGGASVIADSRLQNMERLSSIDAPLMMLRQPMMHEVKRVVEITDTCLVSEITTVKALSRVATALKKEYNIIVMVETGDLREGILVQNLFGFVRQIVGLPYIRLNGIGTNVACLQCIPPTPAILDLLAGSARQLRNELGIELPTISGGNSSVWKLIESGLIPPEVNQFRFGEAVLLGQETINLDPIHGTYQDAVMLEAEIIEVKDKPVPGDGGLRRRAILALGAQDICRGELKPLDVKVRVLKRSSDHLVIDTTESALDYCVGDTLAFTPSYEAMLAAMTSPFVKKVFFP